MKWLLFLIAFGVQTLFAGSVTFYNDSPYKLTATIITASGQNRGSMTVLPQQQMQWQDTGQDTTEFSETPYTVILRCDNGHEYGFWGQVSPGAWITAQGASGNRICPLPKKKQEKQ